MEQAPLLISETDPYQPEAISMEGLERYGTIFSYRCNLEEATPAMRHFLETKLQHPNIVLLYRMGDFYETFFEDAVMVARNLELTLTAKDSGGLGKVPMAGVPMKALDAYLPRLLQAGFKVAICEQMEDPATAKGIVKRDVVRIVSPGTVTEQHHLNTAQASFLVALLLEGNTTTPHPQTPVALAYVDITTGAFYASTLPYAQLIGELERIQPREMLVAGQYQKSGIPGVPGRWVPLIPKEIQRLATCTPLAKDAIVSERNIPLLCTMMQVHQLDGFGIHPNETGLLQVCGMVAHYLNYSFMETPLVLNGIRRVHVEQHVRLSANARRNLELLTSQRAGKVEGSLFASLNRCLTPMGQRLLREWVGAPTHHRAELSSRLDAVEDLVRQPHTRQMLRQLLPNVYDIERLANRLANLQATPRDLSALAQSLKVLPRLSQMVERSHAFYLERVKGFPPELGQAQVLIENALCEAPPVSVKEGGVICPGFSPELDVLRQLMDDQGAWLQGFEARERERTGIKTLKVSYTGAFGYYIEISRANASLAPDDYTRKQTLTQAERFITPELKEHEHAVYQAQHRVVELETQLFGQLRQQLLPFATVMKDVAHRIACVDVLQAFAEVSEQRGYCRPTLVETPILNLVQARHPMIEAQLPAGRFVPNDTHLQGQYPGSVPTSAQVELITGPNMAGKSTYMRQVALAVLMAHMGCFVPATTATIGLIDALYTRIGAMDDVSAGQSTFMVEMAETAEILNMATHRSLVILDEVGRGTSTYDGVAIAWSVLDYMVKHLGCRTLFATHYHELNVLELAHPAYIRNVRVVVSEQEGQGIVFLHRVEAGAAQKSYGIQVAKMAGLPGEVLNQAHQRLNDMQKVANQQLRQRRAQLSGLEESDSQLSIF
jgi:DNA mismatch repair protein MutS